MTEAAAMSAPHRDYFISRSSVDAAFAGRIGKLIAAQGKTTSTRASTSGTRTS
jgi:hypothetical protein